MSEDQWTSYHDIRRRILFEARGRCGVYDDQHPDEFSPDNHPKILVLNNTVLGVIRIDCRDQNAILRRMAVDTPYQGKGYGYKLMTLSERFIYYRGLYEVLSYVAREAVGFYEKCGFEKRDNRQQNPTESVLMYKSLRFWKPL